MALNQQLAQSLLFQEMNATATQKILKKFDKRTSLTYLDCPDNI
jgi:SPX domain